MFLQTGAEFLWLPVGARVSFEQLHTMVDSRSGGKEEQRYTLVIDTSEEKRGKEMPGSSLFKSERQQKNKKKKKGMKRRR